MQIALDANFLNGMIKAAMQQGQDPVKVAYMHGRLSILNSPSVRAGFDRALASYSGNVKRATFAVALRPEVLATAVEQVVQEGVNPIVEELRANLPDHVALSEKFAKVAAARAGQPVEDSALSRFARMKLSDKLALLSSLGAGVGATAGVLSPSHEDQMLDRSTFGRAARGGIKGFGATAGGLLGGIAGNELASRIGTQTPGEFHPLAALLGAGMGGLAGHQLASSVL